MIGAIAKGRSRLAEKKAAPTGFHRWVPPGGAGGNDAPPVLTEMMTNGSLQGMVNAENERTVPAG
jgi:hypothetical protein